VIVLTAKVSHFPNVDHIARCSILSWLKIPHDASTSPSMFRDDLVYVLETPGVVWAFVSGTERQQVLDRLQRGA
jgi:hypothetical protein